MCTPEAAPKISSEEMSTLSAYLDDLAGRGFYGQVVLFFQNGRIDTVRTESVAKIQELAGEKG